MAFQFWAFVKKEWMHIWRDKKTLAILFGMPIVQIIIFGFALTDEVKDSRFAVLNPSKDIASSEIIQEINESRYFSLYSNLRNPAQVEAVFRSGAIKLAILFPENFQQNLETTHTSTIQIIADASDPNVATTLTNYASQIINNWQQMHYPNAQLPLTITSEVRMLYNPQMRGAFNFVPGVMAMVLLLVCTMMTSIAIVKEKENGTMEILLASPLPPWLVIVSKAIPYLLLSTVIIIVILLMSVFLLDVPIAGNIGLLLSVSILFIITALSLGLFISSATNSQQTAMFISLVGMFLPTLMFSGFMFPIENMPVPMQIMSNIVPAKWYFIMVKNVMIKGLGFQSIVKEILVLIGMTIFFIALTIRKFKIRLE